MLNFLTNIFLLPNLVLVELWFSFILALIVELWLSEIMPKNVKSWFYSIAVAIFGGFLAYFRGNLFFYSFFGYFKKWGL
ncbi:TPA: hypothetical protein RTH01_001543 [Campylobacter jejuni]|nr:hypothetical protein [Campylobacter jejuni]HDZ5084652.1 hypothetical protein [Campylobacter jejuni]